MKKLLIIFFLLASISSKVFSLDIAGINLSDNITLPKTNKTLSLQGAGVRTKFIVSVYVGGMYLENKINQAKSENILNSDGLKRMHMEFLYGIDASRIRKSWLEGFTKNNSKENLEEYKEDIKTFVSFFQQDISSGDIIHIDNIPNKGVHVYINEKIVGVSEKNNFYNLILNTWIGKNPPSKKFKNSILG